MKAELAAKLAVAMRGVAMRVGNLPKTGVAGVAGVACGPKPLKLQQLHQLRVKNNAILDVVAGVASITELEPTPSSTPPGVADVARYVSKPLKLQQLRQLRVENTMVGNGAIRGVAAITELEPAPNPAAHNLEHPFPVSSTYGAHWGENLPPDEAESLAKARREVAEIRKKHLEGDLK